MKYVNCPLFNGISEQELKKLLHCLCVKENKFLPGEEICSYNSVSGVLGMLVSGVADVKKLDRDGNYTILEPIGKYGVFSDSFAYTATDANCISVFARDMCTVMFINFDNVFKRCSNACEYHSRLVENLMRIIIAKTKILSQRVEILSNKTICDKIMSYLSLTAKTHGTTTFTLPMSYTSFAQYLCVDRSALMREFKKLNDQGILKVNKKEITVLSKDYI